MTWTIIRAAAGPNSWTAITKDRERKALIDVVGTNVQVAFPAAPKFDWKWCYTTIEEAMVGGCAYVRGVERAVEVHAEETRAAPRRGVQGGYQPEGGGERPRPPTTGSGVQRYGGK